MVMLLTTLLLQEGFDPPETDYLYVTTDPDALVKPGPDLPFGDDVAVDRETPLIPNPALEIFKEGLRGSRLEERFLEDDQALVGNLGQCATIQDERNLVRKALATKAKETGVSPWVLRLVYNRGKRSWAKTDDWNAATPVQWGLARVNSFCCGGRSRRADQDLWEKHKEIQTQVNPGTRG